jgi:uncharacterized protein (TIGR04255 family)
MREQYENPPLIEAACRFRFQSEEPWDDSITDRLHDRLKDVYPTRQQVSVEEEELTDESDTEEVIQLRRDDESGSLSLAPHILTVRRWHRYLGWEEFRAMLMQSLRTYQEVAPLQQLQSAALRYLNYIELPSEGARIEEFTNIEIGLPDIDLQEERVLSGWFQEANLVIRKANAVLDVNAGLVPPTEDAPPFLVLDLVCRYRHENALQLENASEWLEKAHSIIEQMFEACITPQVRAGFGKEKE